MFFLTVFGIVRFTCVFIGCANGRRKEHRSYLSIGRCGAKLWVPQTNDVALAFSDPTAQKHCASCPNEVWFSQESKFQPCCGSLREGFEDNLTSSGVVSGEFRNTSGLEPYLPFSPLDTRVKRYRASLPLDFGWYLGGS